MATMHDFGSSIAGLNRAIRKLPKDAKAELTKASGDISASVAQDAQGRAQRLVTRHGGWKYLGPTIKAVKGSKPGIKIGGKRKLPKRYKGDPRGGDNQTVGDLLWGLEFGGGKYKRTRPSPGWTGSTKQFLPHLGRVAYAMWPAVRAHEGETQEMYLDALQKALEKMR